MVGITNASDFLNKILDQAGQISRAVIASYNQNNDANENRDALIKHSADSLEKTALFLKIELLNDAGKKFYPRKAALAERIILVLESYFPTYCSDCNSTYCTEFGGPEPALRCLSCFQGCHDCDEKLSNLKQLQELSNKCLNGMAWLCHRCYDKNNCLHSRQIEAKVEINDDTVSKIDENAIVLSEQVVASKSSVDLVKKEVCNLYRKGICPHGISGKTLVQGKKCDMFHPKPCKKFQKYGQEKRFGCNDEKCALFHPALCESSVKVRKCFNDKCKLVHLKGTLRKRFSKFNGNFQRKRRPSFQTNNMNRNVADNNCQHSMQRLSSSVSSNQSISLVDPEKNIQHEDSRKVSFLETKMCKMEEQIAKLLEIFSKPPPPPLPVWDMHVIQQNSTNQQGYLAPTDQFPHLPSQRQHPQQWSS